MTRASKSRRLQEVLYEYIHGPRHLGSGALPTSARFLFYELLMDGHIDEKHGTGARRPDQDVSDALMVLRREGLVPWEWIRDETRRLTTWPLYATIADGIREELQHVRLDPWAGRRPLILTESRSLAGVLEDTAYTYGAAIAATNGQVGGFLHTDLIPFLREGQRVLYLGDLDLAGRHIEANTRAEIERVTGALDWRRLAITEEQVARYDIPAKPKLDHRYRDGHLHDAYETEALSQSVIVGLVVEALDAILPEPLDSLGARADAERDVIAAALTNVTA
jgi:hypothetical protein